MFRLSLLLLLVLLVFHLSATKKFEIEGSGVTLDEYEDEQEEETLTNFTLSPKNSTSSSITRADDEFLDDFEENFYDESLSSSSSTSSTMLPPLIRSTPTPTKIRAFFNFIARPPIAAGILVGLFSSSASNDDHSIDVLSDRFRSFHWNSHLSDSSGLFNSTNASTCGIAIIVYHGFTLSESLWIRENTSGILRLIVFLFL